ncbi:MAG TPA: hypothetical protein VND65_09065 [Candidatus Binatia bacterium]|nr:hypothetical protein [Candidatus Binatia bacterium]
MSPTRHFDPLSLLAILRDLAVLLVPAGAAAWAWFRTRHANSWPSTQGTILSTQVQSDTDSPILPWAAKLTYTYVVNGEYYSGFHCLRARSERRAEEKIAGWKDRMVVVRYSPTEHGLSILRKADQPGGLLGN